MFFSLFKPIKIISVQRRLLHKYLFRMDKAYLRYLGDSKQFQITFQYCNPEQKVDRQFNFARQLSECVNTFLSRVITNVEKVANKKRKVKKTVDDGVTVAITADLYLNDERVSGETICSDVFKEDSRVVLKILEKTYDVIINSPYVDNIALPSSILAKFPTYPAKLDTVQTNLELSNFTWYKSRDKVTWQHVGNGYIYTPTEMESDNYLKLHCTPKNQTKEGPSIETISTCKVGVLPGTCPFEDRHMFTQQKCKMNEFRIVTYNILADLYCDSDHTRTVLYPYCPPYALAIDYRKQLILKEVLGYNADIICLQEVDRKVYCHYLEHILKMYDYGSHFTLKGGSVAEGLACFYNNKKFELLDQLSIILSERIKSDQIFIDIWDKVSKNEKLYERFLDRKTAMQVTVLKSKENQKVLLVANTHLYFHPDSDHIRLIQGVMCIKYVQSIYDHIVEKVGDENVSVIFCGDFNSVPECGIYKLYTTGYVGSDCIDWRSNEDEAVTDLSVTQPFNLSSACGTPKYTNYTSGFADCLDYIFYDRTKLKVSQVIPLPSDEKLIQNTALPSIFFPSDHIALVSDIKWFKT